jgi:hypothetical protein
MSNYESLFENIRLSLLRIAESHPEIWERITERSPEGKMDCIVDSYKDWERKALTYHCKLSNLLREYDSSNTIEDYHKQCINEHNKLLDLYPIPQLSIIEIVDKINTAFFKLERYMEGKTDLYHFFGFNDAFTILFDIMENPENETPENFKRIDKYYKLLAQINYDFDNSNFENFNAFENVLFCNDCEEIGHLWWDRSDEFIQFGLEEEDEKRYSIHHIIENNDAGDETKILKNSFKINNALKSNGFFEIEKVKVLSEANQSKLIKLILDNKLPYRIAMLDFLDFFSYLEQEYSYTKTDMYTRVSDWLGADRTGRSVKGNILGLLKASNENKERYTAHLHKEKVKKDYQNLI